MMIIIIECILNLLITFEGIDVVYGSLYIDGVMSCEFCLSDIADIAQNFTIYR